MRFVTTMLCLGVCASVRVHGSLMDFIDDDREVKITATANLLTSSYSYHGTSGPFYPEELFEDAYHLREIDKRFESMADPEIWTSWKGSASLYSTFSPEALTASGSIEGETWLESHGERVTQSFSLSSIYSVTFETQQRVAFELCASAASSEGLVIGSHAGVALFNMGTTYAYLFVDDGEADKISTTGVLEPGRYTLYGFANYGYHLSTNGSWHDITSASFDIEFHLIPGPASLALLGVAGLLGGRRRRR